MDYETCADLQQEYDQAVYKYGEDSQQAKQAETDAKQFLGENHEVNCSGIYKSKD